MSQYQKTWADAKKTFEQQTGTKKPAAIEDTIFGAVRKGTGIEAVLKKIDTAIQKKERTPAREAFQEFFVVYGDYEQILQKAKSNLSKQDDFDPESVEYQALQLLSTTLKDIMAEMDTDIKNLSDSKSPIGEAMPTDTFLGDVNSQLKAYDKVVKKFPAQEKSWKLVDKCQPLVKALTNYEKAAAKSKFADVIKYLEDSIKAIKEITNHCDTILKEKSKHPKDADYFQSVEQSRAFFKNLPTSRLNGAKAKAEELLDKSKK